jgi:2-phosphosulfolactate phosphatase
MDTNLDVLFTPAEFSALAERDLTGTVCVVFDVLRATSSIVTALANGAVEIVPVVEISEALELRKQNPELLLAGERNGLRIQGQPSGGIAFDLGNSPREFTRARVGGKKIAVTTTNGTRALRACLAAKTVLASSFLNLRATFEGIAKEPAIVLVCSGTYEEAAYEDILAAGALCDLLWPSHGAGIVSDSAYIAQILYQLEKGDLLAGVSKSRNGRRLLANPDLRDDVAFCAQRDIHSLVAALDPSGSLMRTE